MLFETTYIEKYNKWFSLCYKINTHRLLNLSMTDLKRVPEKGRKSTEKPSHRLAEIALIPIFVIFGSVGLFLVLDHMKFRADKTFENPIYDHPSVDDNRSEDTKGMAVAVKKPAEDKMITSKQLHVGGPREALTPVLFEVENFNQNAEYLLDFGDGIRRVLNQRTESHIYKKAGNYELSLYVTFQGKRRVLTNKDIEIMEPITVATNATLIDFKKNH